MPRIIPVKNLGLTAGNILKKMWFIERLMEASHADKSENFKLKIENFSPIQFGLKD
jgi:hypothetical protein